VREEELQALSALGAVKSFPKNAVIVSEGDETDAFYVILAGRVKVYVSDEDGNEAVLGTQKPGDYFGEMVLDGGPGRGPPHARPVPPERAGGGGAREPPKRPPPRPDRSRASPSWTSTAASRGCCSSWR
jgi:CRP-like cAMP-binding protein